MSDQKKLLSIELEPDMWFEICDQLRDRLDDMKTYMDSDDSKGDTIIQRQYIYLKVILDKLEHELTS